MKKPVSCVILGVAAVTAPPAVAIEPTSPNIRSSPYGIDLAPAVAPRVSCYRLTVRRRYYQRQRGTYDLAITVRRAAQPVPGRDPVLYLHGGPGGGTTSGAVNAEDPFFPGATVVYIASRGSYPSEPQPCRDLDPKKIEALTGQRTWTERVKIYSRVYLECRGRLDGLGIPTDEFGTHINNEDIEQFRKALGIKQWNVCR